MQEDRVPGKSDIRVRLPAGNFRKQNESAVQGWTSVPVAMDGEKGPSRKRIKAEFDYDDRKGVGACDRRPSRLETTRGMESRDTQTAHMLSLPKSPPRPD